MPDSESNIAPSEHISESADVPLQTNVNDTQNDTTQYSTDSVPEPLVSKDDNNYPNASINITDTPISTTNSDTNTDLSNISPSPLSSPSSSDTSSSSSSPQESPESASSTTEILSSSSSSETQN